MHIKYSPFIDLNVTIASVEADLDGNVVLTTAPIKGKAAQLTMPIKEAAKLFRSLKTIDVESLLVVHGG